LDFLINSIYRNLIRKTVIFLNIISGHKISIEKYGCGREVARARLASALL
jgi:hypothetical protein